MSASPESEWRTLYKAGAIAAIAVLALVPFQILVFAMASPPTTTLGWFQLFEQSQLVGLLSMDLLLIVDQILLAIMLAAVIVALRRASRSWLTIAGLLGLVAFACYLASNPAFEMLSVAERYASASTAVERTQLLGAGHAFVAQWAGTAFTTGYVLGALVFLILGALMVRDERFGRAVGWIGVAFGITSLVPASAGTIGLVLSLVSLIPMWMWLVLVAMRLLRLVRSGKPVDGHDRMPSHLAASSPSPSIMIEPKNLNV